MAMLTSAGMMLTSTVMLLTSTVMLLTLVLVGANASNICNSEGTQPWNKDDIQLSILSWLVSINQLHQGPNNVRIQLFDQKSQDFQPYYDQFWGNNDPKQITILERTPKPVRDIAWQLVSKDRQDGLLYSTWGGDWWRQGNLTFVYPDFRTGLYGFFKNREFVVGHEVIITGERCHNGIKELRTEIRHPHVVWKREPVRIGHMPSCRKRMDPFERKSVYVGESSLPGSGEGLFARRSLENDELVSYFGGTLTYRENFLFPGNMTEGELDSAGSMFYNLGRNSNPGWNIDPELVLDVPKPYRSIVEYRTTLGHKVNHKFEEFGGANSRFTVVIHPFLGKIACLTALRKIKREEEIFVDYSYQIGSAPRWFKEYYRREKKKWEKFKRTKDKKKTDNV